MAHATEGPWVELWGKTHVNPDAIMRWLKRKGVSDDAIYAIIEEHKSHAEMAVEVAGRRCYMSYEPLLNPNITKIRTNILEYIDNLLAKKDGSVLEHVVFNFAIEDVSRVFTGEFNRHRAGTAISEGSMRYIRYTDIPYWVPTCWQKDETAYDTKHLGSFSHGTSKEAMSRTIMQEAFEAAQSYYTRLVAIWKEELESEGKNTFAKKKEITSALRRIIPMGVATGGVWSGNIRALRHIFEMRSTPFAEEEILLVATLLLNVMRDSEPAFFGDFSTDELGFSKPKYSKV